MKIYYVSDNRTGANWGCRGTSIALAEHLSQRHKVIAAMFNSTKKEAAEMEFTHGTVEDAIAGLLKVAAEGGEFGAVVRRVKRADLIVVNGEGDMIFSPERKTLIFLLAIIHLAADLGKKVYFVNAMVSDCPKYGRDPAVFQACLQALRRCSGIGLRDELSLALLKEADFSLPAALIPDALFQWSSMISELDGVIQKNGNLAIPYPHEQAFGTFDFTGDYICVGGSSAASRLPRDERAAIILNLVTEVEKLGLPIYLVETSPGDKFLRSVAYRTKLPLVPMETSIVMGALILANARLLISGRYHPSILASLGGTPFVSLASNSHKMSGLQKLLGVHPIEEFPFGDDAAAFGKVTASAERCLSMGSVLRSELKERATLAGRASREGLERLLQLG